MGRRPVVGQGRGQRPEDQPRQQQEVLPAPSVGEPVQAGDQERDRPQVHEEPWVDPRVRGRAAEQVRRRPLRPVVRPGELQGLRRHALMEDRQPGRPAQEQRVREGEAVRDEDDQGEAGPDDQVGEVRATEVATQDRHDRQRHDDGHQQGRVVGVRPEGEDDRRADRRTAPMVAQADPQQTDPGHGERQVGRRLPGRAGVVDGPRADREQGPAEQRDPAAEPQDEQEPHDQQRGQDAEQDGRDADHGRARRRRAPGTGRSRRSTSAA